MVVGGGIVNQSDMPNTIQKQIASDTRMTWSFIHRETRSSLNDEDRTCMTNRALLMANDFGSRRLGRNPKAARVRLSYLLECRAGNPIRLRHTEWIYPVLRTIRAGVGACTIVFDADDGVIRNRTWLTATTRLRTVASLFIPCRYLRLRLCLDSFRDSFHRSRFPCH